MAIIAIKKGITRTFSDEQWNRMPSDKYGWALVSESEQTTNIPIPENIIQKKMVAGAENAKPDIIVKTPAKESIKMDVPEELITKVKKDDTRSKKQ